MSISAGFRMRIALAAVAIVVGGAAAMGRAAAQETPRLVVALLQPSARARGPDRLGYSVSIGSTRFESGDALINALADSKGTDLAILVRDDVPAGAITTLAALASKAGFLRYSVFVFNRKRDGMVALPSFRWIDFSADPEVIGKLVR